MLTPLKLGHGDHRSERRCPLQLWVSRVLPSPPCPCRSHFSLEVKLNSSSGLLFYVAGERGTFMALFVSNGRFVFLLDVGGRRLRIRSKDKYRDRRWHTVSGGLGLGTSLSPIAGCPCRGQPGAAPLWASLPNCTRDTRGPGGTEGTAKTQSGLNLPAEVSLPCAQPWGSS